MASIRFIYILTLAIISFVLARPGNETSRVISWLWHGLVFEMKRRWGRFLEDLFYFPESEWFAVDADFDF
jgi:hypothetical protein